MPKNRNMQIALSKKWNAKFHKTLKVSYKKDGIKYVEHTQVTQRLIAIIPDVKMEILDKIYDDFTNPITGEEKKILTGIAYRISGTIDNEFRVVEEIGMCDKPFYNPDTETTRKILTNGERGKECLSDAIKRCSMRLGIGIELYDTDTWIVDYLSPKPKASPKKETKSDHEEKDLNPESKTDEKEIEMLKVDMNNIDEVVKEISEKKSVSK